MAQRALRREPPRPRGDDRATPTDLALLHVVDTALAGCIFLVPLLMGGRHAVGQFALVGLASVAGIAWTIRLGLCRAARWRFSRAEWLLSAGVALLLLQIAPLPGPLLAWLTPHGQSILPIWADQADTPGGFGAWSTISLTPGATRSALAVFLAYAVLFVVCVQRIESRNDVERLLRWIAYSALIMASFGLVQLLTSNGKFFWLFEHPFTDTSDVAKGSFTNRNHFAHFLALGMGPLIWWLQHHQTEPLRRKPGMGGGHGGGNLAGLRTLAVGVVLFAGLLSLSRGGAIAMSLAVILSVAVCCRARVLSIRFAMTLVAVALLGAAMLSIHGYDRFSQRLDKLASGSIEEIDGATGGRRQVWANTLRGATDFPLLGSGAGSFQEVHLLYEEQPGPTVASHAESGPLQVLLEMGLLGLGLVAVGGGYCLCWCVRGMRRAGSSRTLVCMGAVSAGLLVSMVHTLVDFVWYVPACMAIVSILAACACRLWQIARDESQEPATAFVLPKYVAPAAAAVLAVVGGWASLGRFGAALAEPCWNRYRIMEMAATRQQNRRAAKGAADWLYQIDIASAAELEAMIADLREAVRHDPDHARAHVRLAAAYLRRFNLARMASENAMPLAHIREAAIQSWNKARSRQERQAVSQWLRRTLAEDRNYLERAQFHAMQGLKLCPLQGEAYLYVAELRFLDGPETEYAAYFDQAGRVRPYDGDILFEAGRLAATSGHIGECLQYWKRSCQVSQRHQRRVIQALAVETVPVQPILEHLKPDLFGSRLLAAYYRRHNRADDLTTLRPYYLAAVSREAERLSGKQAAPLWLEACSLCRQMNNTQDALRYAQNAYRCQPNDFAVRHNLAQRLIDVQQFAEARKHLQWCVGQRPGNSRLQQALRNVTDRQFQAAHLTSDAVALR